MAEPAIKPQMEIPGLYGETGDMPEPVVPEWGAKHPNLYGATGALYETVRPIAERGALGAGLRQAVGYPPILDPWQKRGANPMTAGTGDVSDLYSMTSPIGATPAIAGTYVGKAAKGWAGLPGKFSSMADKMQRAEISDFGAKIKPHSTAGWMEGKAQFQLQDILEHPELYKQYPELKTMPLKYDAINAQGQYLGPKKGIEVRPDLSPQELKDIVLHEVQHPIQEIEGFAKGGSPASAESKDISKLKQAYQWALQDNDTKAARQIHSEIQKARFDAYWKQAGEIEARDTALRSNLTDIERANTPPYSIENIPLSEWITRGHGDAKSYQEMKSIGDFFKKAPPAVKDSVLVRQLPSGEWVAQTGGMGKEARILTKGPDMIGVMKDAKAKSAPGTPIKSIANVQLKDFVEQGHGDIFDYVETKGVKK